MATYLLDTTVYSLLVKEHPAVRARLVTLELTHRIVICTVVRGEVLYGLELMARGKKRRDLETKIMDLFSPASHANLSRKMQETITPG